MNILLKTTFALIYLFFQPIAWASCQGCCSSHGGVSKSCAANGRVICNDRTISPSCGCNQCSVNSCTPKKEQRTISCPTGQSGSIQQEHNFTCAMNGLWSEWETIKNTCIPENANYQNVAEFYNNTNKHYFMTSSVEEANAIDNGSAGPGWKRTGNSFKVWPKNSNEKDTLLVCRFYNAGASSHFFTANPAECQALRNIEIDQREKAEADKQPFMGWGFEGDDYRVKVPAPDGSCPSGTDQIYRAYNNRHEYNDQNHRFSPWPDDLIALQKTGWVIEGVAMCAPKY